MPSLTYLAIGKRALSSFRYFSTANFTNLRTLILKDEAMQYGYEFAIENTPHLSRLEIGSGCFSYGTKFSLGRGIPQTVLISRPPRPVHADRR